MRREISIALSERGLTYPEKTVVRMGDEIVWRCRAETQDKAQWTIYFHHKSPFTKEIGYPDRFEASEVARTKEIDRFEAPELARTVELGPFVANEPGDYKYGVRADNLDTGSQLADDDPYLIVRS